MKRADSNALIVALTLVLTTSSARAADAALEKPIHQFVNAFNKADLKAAEAAFTANPTISDELAPHLWTGPGAVRGWYSALAKDLKDHGDAEPQMTLAVPTREVVSGDRGYVILPAVLTFLSKGKTMREDGQLTLVLIKTGSAWKIATWTWSSAS